MTRHAPEGEFIVMGLLMVVVFVVLWLAWAHDCLGSGPCS